MATKRRARAKSSAKSKKRNTSAKRGKQFESILLAAIASTGMRRHREDDGDEADTGGASNIKADAVSKDLRLKLFYSRNRRGKKIVPVPEEYVANVNELMTQLTIIKAAVADKMNVTPSEARITIVSGWRSPAHNRRVKGATGSHHLTGKAADFRIYIRAKKQEDGKRKWSLVDQKIVFAVCKNLMKRRKIMLGGCKAYIAYRWVHYDTRGWVKFFR
tara:strand:+ start:2771 stop:3421 length:651 start_codon:yes stop_codon:yes gene_type:complete